MTVAIIDYESGNLHSVAAAFRRTLAAMGKDENAVRITSDAATLSQATHIVLPGVGAFADCMAGLQALPGMIDALNARVREEKTPFMGICVGMQMMLSKGYEHGDTQGLGWIEGEVVHLKPADASLKIPHMGWNELQPTTGGAVLFSGVEAGAHVYFVHSYHAVCAKASDVLATVEYGGNVVAAIGHENMVGTQFHPEKSQRVGEAVIANFLQMT